MDGLARLLLRFILVPLGYFAGVLAGTLVILLGSWKIGRADALEGEAHAIAVYGYVFAAPVLLVVLLSVMWLPAAIGVLLAETFALRSWMFHAGNGVVSAWIAWNLFGYMDASHIALNQPGAVIAAGLAGGFAYWAIAGWNAGFWKPLLRPAAQAALPPAAASPPPQMR
ncbi:MAG TPA: hypothetical protein VJ376_00095 [Pseudomonadota bacterium]|nr:hypothetical protein [Pseudomonadota bacterium]